MGARGVGKKRACFGLFATLFSSPDEGARRVPVQTRRSPPKTLEAMRVFEEGFASYGKSAEGDRWHLNYRDYSPLECPLAGGSRRSFKGLIVQRGQQTFSLPRMHGSKLLGEVSIRLASDSGDRWLGVSMGRQQVFVVCSTCLRSERHLASRSAILSLHAMYNT